MKQAKNITVSHLNYLVENSKTRIKIMNKELLQNQETIRKLKEQLHKSEELHLELWTSFKAQKEELQNANNRIKNHSCPFGGVPE